MYSMPHQALTGIDQLKDLINAYRRFLGLLGILIAAPLPVHWLLPMYAVDASTAWSTSALWATAILAIAGVGSALLIQRSTVGKGCFKIRVRIFLFLAGVLSLLTAGLAAV